MNIYNIDFYYFSGTGNTLLVVKRMKEVFERNDVKVNLYRIEKTNPLDINLNHTLGLGFPVAEQGTYPFVWDFIESLPASNETRIFMVDTLLAYSGGVVGPIKKIVARKGYTPIGADEIRMPNNLFRKKIIPGKVENKIGKGLNKAEKYANDILNGISKWRRLPVFSDIMSVFSKSENTWKFLRRFYHLRIDTSKCIKCGLCIDLCPVNNIKMNEFPEFQDKCKICMRCISFCPEEAIYSPKKKYIRYSVVKAGELLQDE